MSRKRIDCADESGEHERADKLVKELQPVYEAELRFRCG